MIKVDDERTEVRGNVIELMADFTRVCLAMKEVATDKKFEMKESLAIIMTLRQAFDDVMSGKLDDKEQTTVRESDLGPSDDAEKCFSRDMILNEFFKDVKGETQ